MRRRILLNLMTITVNVLWLTGRVPYHEALVVSLFWLISFVGEKRDD